VDTQKYRRDGHATGEPVVSHTLPGPLDTSAGRAWIRPRDTRTPPGHALPGRFARSSTDRLFHTRTCLKN